jgi:hypothetical protein
MKKSEEKSQLEAPVRLTPEQLEIVAAGFKPLGGKGFPGGTTTSGAISPRLGSKQF